MNCETSHRPIPSIGAEDTDASRIAQALLKLKEAGISVLPIDHRSKMPASHLLPRDAEGNATWKPYQSQVAEDEMIARWIRAKIKAIGIVCGKVSGGIRVFDFDVERFYHAWRKQAGELAEGLPVQRTGGGGYQVSCRCENPGGNTKLAYAPDDTEETGRTIAIETRGEGGYAVVAPSLHPNGNHYEMIAGDLAAIPRISQARADALLAAARKLDECPHTRQEIEAIAKAAVADHEKRVGKSRNGSSSVINQFNSTHNIEAVLEQHGYSQKGDRFVRPGGTNPSVTITKGRSCHFSTNDPLNDGKVKDGIGVHDAFDVFAHYEHGGDIKVAVRAAAELLGLQAPRQCSGPSSGNDPGEAQGSVALGARDPSTGKLVLSPKMTLPTAEAFVREFYQNQESRTIHTYAGALLTWRGNRFAEIEEGAIKQTMQAWLHNALRYISGKSRGMELVAFESNPSTINAAVESIRAYTHLDTTVTPPCWLGDAQGLPDAKELLPFSTGTLHVPSGDVLPPTPSLFNINALDFVYNPQAPRPDRWLEFLEQLWGSDHESIQLLQEWMGYSLVADTSQQKMLLLVGPKRSGKGTIGRVLARLVGIGNIAGPTTSSLAGPFGLQPLIGKSLAILSDARFSGENVGIVVERLLCISGEDAVTVDRKFMVSVTMKLPTRFMFLTNELPRMNDASGALAGRFIILRLTNSFYGKEDVTLTERLMDELPGILLWAIEGLKRLRERRCFVQPQAVAQAVRDLEDLASPVMAFVRDYCTVGPGCRVGVDDLYSAWKSWCEQDGRTLISNKQTFGRDLSAAVPGITRRRGTGDLPFYEGIAIKGGVS